MTAALNHQADILNLTWTIISWNSSQKTLLCAWIVLIIYYYSLYMSFICYICTLLYFSCVVPWVVVITTTQFYSTKPELRLCGGLNLALGASEIHDCEEVWQWSPLEIRLNTFCWSTIPQKHTSSSSLSIGTSESKCLSYS